MKINIVLILSTGLLFNGISSADIVSNLAGYWKLDDGSGVTAVDSSGNNNNGILASASGPVWVKEKFNLSLSFDGIDDYVNINDSPSLQFGTGDFTVAAWIKFPINSSSIGWEGIINKGFTTSGPVHTWALVRSSTNARRVRFYVTSDNNDNWASVETYTDLSDGWHHIAVKRASQALSMYVDGTFIHSSGISFTATLNASVPLTLGVGGSRYVSTTMDEVRIYKRALSASDVLELYSYVPPAPAIDTQAPTVPAGLDAAPISYSQVNLSWIVSTDNVSVAGYKIYRNEMQISSSPTGNSYFDTTALPETDYLYTVSAYDWSGNESARSNADFVTTPGSRIVNASSCEQADVQEAVDASKDGDIVNIPAGTCTWNAPVAVNKNITLRGAGSDSTIINNNAGILIMVVGKQNSLIRLSGIRFNNSDEQSPIVALVGPISKARIDHCVFNKGDCAVGTNFLGDPKGTGPVYGVVDHCTFYNMIRPYYPTDRRQGDSTWGAIAWTEPILPGSDKMMYFEDNQFIWDSNLTAFNAQGALYGQYGGKCCFRYNNCKGFCTYVDAHGDGPEYGTAFYEIYNNTFDMDHTHCIQGDILWQRGGQWICHDNVVTGVNAGIFYRLSVYHTTDLAEHRVKNSYFWNDTYYGNTNEAVMVTVTDSGQTPAGYSAANIQLNQEYFLHAPEPGQVYYPYTPYQYPHPLTQPPSVPSSVRDGQGSDAGFTTLTTQLSANWDISIDTYSGMARYLYAIGSSPGATDVKGWTDNGMTTSATRPGLNLTVGTTYYFSIKAENRFGLQSSTATSNGQYISGLPDTTPPANIAVVRDGTGVDVGYTASTTTLSANWDDSADIESGISKYYFAIGTNPGLADITNWTTNGIETSATKAGLSLAVGVTYYFSVRAENGEGLQSGITTSNGQYVTETIVEPQPSTVTIITAALAYPNPVDFRQGNLTFKAVDNAGAEVKIYTTGGRLVKKLAIENGENNVEWDGTNEADEKVIRGVYVYMITQNNGDKLTGKLAVR